MIKLLFIKGEDDEEKYEILDYMDYLCNFYNYESYKDILNSFIDGTLE